MTLAIIFSKHINLLETISMFSFSSLRQEKWQQTIKGLFVIAHVIDFMNAQWLLFIYHWCPKEQEETRMQSNGDHLVTGYRQCPDFMFKTSISKNEHNYALSVCHRRTLIRHRGIFYHNVHDTNIHFTFFKKKSFV